MKISIDLPDDVVARLVDAGQDLSLAALEALAIDAYRMNRITGHQLRQLLDIQSGYDLDGVLKRHGVPRSSTPSTMSSARARQVLGCAKSGTPSWLTRHADRLVA